MTRTTTTARALRLGADLALPLDAVTETIAILGIRGSGKTNTAVVLTEELLTQGQQVVIVDPTDVWWGLKASADGGAGGFPIVVLGGRHGDLPLSGADGATLADFVVDEHASVILSLRHFESQAEQRRLVTDFARRLYHRKGQAGGDTPLMVIIDEASLFVPQRVSHGEAQMVGAIQKLVRQGRASGLGVTLIDQRASTVNKDVLTQLELLICHRTSSPQDRKALEAWVEQHDAADHRQEFLASLASLPRGTAWCWSPGWLDLFQRVPVRARQTFDSSRTPKAGERVTAPRELAHVDLDALRRRMATTLEKARADDPAELRKQLKTKEAEIRRLQQRAPVAAPVPAPAPAPIEVPVIPAADLAALERCTGELARILGEADQVTARIRDALTTARAIARAPVPRSSPAGALAPVRTPAARQRPATPTKPSTTRASGDGGAAVTRPQQRILDALAFLETIGLPQAKKTQLALLSDASPKSSAFQNNLGQLRTAGLLDYPAGGYVALTDAGRGVARAPDVPPTSADLQAMLLGRLSQPQGRILTALIESYPEALAKAELAERAEASPASSAFQNNLGTLRSLGVIDYPQGGYVVALPVLFLEA